MPLQILIHLGWLWLVPGRPSSTCAERERCAGCGVIGQLLVEEQKTDHHHCHHPCLQTATGRREARPMKQCLIHPPPLGANGAYGYCFGQSSFKTSHDRGDCSRASISMEQIFHGNQCTLRLLYLRIHSK